LEWFPWKQIIVGAVLLIVAILAMKRRQDTYGLGRTAKFFMFAGIAAVALWAAAAFPGLDRYFSHRFQFNALFRSALPFAIVWAIANARNLKRRANGQPETLTTFAVKCGFASGLAGRLLFDAAVDWGLRWPSGISRSADRAWLIANGVGLGVYLIIYLGKRD